MSVFIDPSACTYVYGCDQCSWWRGVALSRESAEEQMIRHEEQNHGTQHRRSVRDRRRARHAAKIGAAPEMVGSTPEHLTHGNHRLAVGDAAIR